MVNSKLKNIIVLKGMASNVVQEAIVILKPNIELEKGGTLEKNKEISNRKKCVISEAEYIISNYIQEIENTNYKRKKRNLEKKYKISKALNLALIISLIIIVF